MEVKTILSPFGGNRGFGVIPIGGEEYLEARSVLADFVDVEFRVQLPHISLAAIGRGGSRDRRLGRGKEQMLAVGQPVRAGGAPLARTQPGQVRAIDAHGENLIALHVVTLALQHELLFVEGDTPRHFLRRT
ncbi:MAG: hypothetical protein MZV64_14805 [Ignavibacteriales bacterium]|nr:hypothetical protein [Ignavibacteriales bacterium]